MLATASRLGLPQRLLPGGWKTLDSGTLEEPSLPGVHKDSKATAGHLFSHAVLMSVYCVILAFPGPYFVLFCCIL